MRSNAWKTVSMAALVAAPAALAACSAASDGAPVAGGEKVGATHEALVSATPPPFPVQGDNAHYCTSGSGGTNTPNLTSYFIAYPTTCQTWCLSGTTRWSVEQAGTTYSCVDPNTGVCGRTTYPLTEYPDIAQHNHDLFSIPKANGYRYLVQQATISFASGAPMLSGTTGPKRFLQGLADWNKSWSYTPQYTAPAQVYPYGWTSDSHPPDGDQAANWQGADWKTLFEVAQTYKGDPNNPDNDHVKDGFPYTDTQMLQPGNGQPAICAVVYGYDPNTGALTAGPIDAFSAADDYDPQNDPW